MYQTAKIAKLLLIIDRGEAHKYKGKELQDIKVEETDCLEVEKEEIQEGMNSIPNISVILFQVFQSFRLYGDLKKSNKTVVFVKSR